MATQTLKQALAERETGPQRLSNYIEQIQSYWSRSERERRQRVGEIRRRELTLLLKILGSGTQPR